MEASEPLDLVHIDFVSMETTIATKKKPVVQKVLVVIDHFMRYIQVYPVDNEQAEKVADALYNKYFCTFGFPHRLMSDQAQAFVGKVIGKLCQKLQVEKVRTSPYHPQSDGQVERIHQVLMRMIGKLDNSKKKHWPEHIAPIFHAYNATQSQVTGYSPYFLMFGQWPRIPIDLLFPTARWAEDKSLDNYITALYEHIKEAVSKAKLMADKEVRRYKRVYNRQAGAVELWPRDKVLVRLDAYRGQRRKLKNWWGSELHTVVHQVVDGVPAYMIVWDSDQKKREKVLHHAHLLLWFADNDSNADGIRLNYLNITSNWSSVTNAENTDPMSEAHSEGEMGAVSRELDYGMDLANFILWIYYTLAVKPKWHVWECRQVKQARGSLLSRMGTLASLEMPTSGKTFSLAETRGLSPAGTNLTFKVAMGELAIIEQHCPIPLVADFEF